MTLCRIVWAAGLRAELGKMPPKRLQFVDCMHMCMLPLVLRHTDAHKKTLKYRVCVA